MDTMLFFNVCSEKNAVQTIFNYFHLKLLTNDMIYRDDPDECHDYLLDVIFDISTKPMFVYVVESDGHYHQDGTDGTSGVVPGMRVAIVRKENQNTDRFDEGIVDEVLTKSMFHRRGIKVRLKDGKIGRVQKIFC